MAVKHLAPLNMDTEQEDAAGQATQPFRHEIVGVVFVAKQGGNHDHRGSDDRRDHEYRQSDAERIYFIKYLQYHGSHLYISLVQ